MIVHDTICALATPPGVGGLSVVRLSGSEAFTIADRCFRGKNSLHDFPSHTIHYGKFFSPDGTFIDTVTASLFRAPHSYTGEHTVEFGCHGGLIVSQEIITSLLLAGARPAQPGEFTKRAFLNSKIDLTQAEAVADLIHSVSRQGTHAAARQLLGGLTQRLQELRTSLLDICGLLELELDFSTEDIEFVDRTELRSKLRDAITFCKNLSDSFRSSEILRSGYKIGIVGYPNAGKSSLLNTILQKKRAIVSETPGTTRDYIEEQIIIDGVTFTIFDTAGFRSSEDQIEIEGIKLAHSLLDQCNLILIINDSSMGVKHSETLLQRLQEQFPESAFALVQNKTDKENSTFANEVQNSEALPIFGISALTGTGITELKSFLVSKASHDMEHAGSTLINARHVHLLKLASLSLEAALEAVEVAPSNEFIAIDVREALRKIGEITGDSWSEDVLDHVFSRFCIGK
jgi:tRNA modification GTPase